MVQCICSLAFTRLGKKHALARLFWLFHYTIQVCRVQSTGSGGSTPADKQGAVIQTLR